MQSDSTEHQPHWLAWSQQLQALAQTGLSFTKNPFDILRYQAVRQISAEIMASQTAANMDDIRITFDAQSGYATPKVSVRSAVFKDNQVLMVYELSDGLWTLPGGWIDINETPGQAAEREVWEETGYRVRAARLLAVYDNRRHGHPPFPFHLYNFFFECDLRDGHGSLPEPYRGNVETGESAFFSLASLPPLSIARTTLDEINRMFYLHTHPELPTEFD
jgi:ADP-ribose pyrophosphatase YjhB (NUDIX family)